jgi:hypothetical protein
LNGAALSPFSKVPETAFFKSSNGFFAPSAAFLMPSMPSLTVPRNAQRRHDRQRPSERLPDQPATGATSDVTAAVFVKWSR